MTHQMNAHDRTDVLISHVVDGEASAAEWQELERLAAGEPRLWRELAAAQRDAAALRGAMRAATDVADRVAMPAVAAHESTERVSETHTFAHPRVRMNRFGAWTGWLVAAVVMIAATVQYAQNNGGPASHNANIGEGLAQSAGELWNAYLTKGQQDGSVLGEVPGKMLVESRPVPAGQGVEVIYVRQVIERAVVPDLYKIDGIDERGQPTLARYRQPLRKTM